jgi:uridine kinase
MSYIEQKKLEILGKQLITVIWQDNYYNPSNHVSDNLEINQDFDTYLILLTIV